MSKPVHLIHGGDEYLVTAKAKNLAEKLVPVEQRALGLEVVEGAATTVEEAVRAIVQCLEALCTVGLFGGSKVVWLRDAAFLSDAPPGKSDAVKSRVDELAQLIKAGLSEGQVLIVSAPKVDKRFAFYKACVANGEVQEFAVSDKAYANEKTARERLQTMLRKRGLRMAEAAVSAFMEKVGTDTRQLVNEVEKLTVFLGEEKTVTVRDVEAVTSASRGAIAWDLADSVGERDLSRAVKVVRQLLFQKESPIRLVSSIGGRIRELIVYREAMDKGWLQVQRQGRGMSVQWAKLPAEAESALKAMPRNPRDVHPFRAGKLAEQAALFTAGKLRKCQAAVMEAHGKLVTTALPKPTILELLLVDIIC